jgi:glucose-6-phosphate dehydrogenase assembly protein OpcA
MVLFTVRGYSVLQLQSLLSLFILRDLPAYLWWLISSEESLDGLSSLGSTVIIDSALWANSLQGLVMLQRRAQVQQVIDLAWLRLQPWRELIASVFDAPRERRILERCQEVSVIYGGVQRSGCWEVFLLLGWLASALQWRCQAIKWPEAPSDALTVRHGDNEISLRWNYAAQESDVGLQQILFRADEEQAVTIQRHLPNEAIVSVTGGNTRCVALRSVETSQALSLAFQQVEHDGAFQRTARWLISSEQAIGSVHA